jgi:lambda family phage portal protein
MPRPSSLADLINPGSLSLPTPPPAQRQGVIRRSDIKAFGSSSGSPYDAASTGRRFNNWNPSRLGPTSQLWTSLDFIRARCREQIRDNPWAASAIDNFESQVIGNGIKPRWNIPNKSLKKQIEDKFGRWAMSKSIDHEGQLNFYGLQALASREIFEAGEVFVRLHSRPPSWRMKVPFQLQLIEGEQVPVFKNEVNAYSASTGLSKNSIRTGIEFDPDGRRVAYHMYKQNPGETMFFPTEGLVFTRIDAKDILHSYKPKRAGQLRGEPHLVSVLTALYELDQYTDATLVKKKVSAMFSGFIEKVSPDADIIVPTQSEGLDPNSQFPPLPTTLNIQNSEMQPGTLVNLFAGEKITFPNLPVDADIETFLRVMLHRFAVAVGATYEQITGDLKGVNYSSIRAGLLDFRRKCEQFQLNIIIQQLCQPVAVRWLEEAYLSGAVKLPGYAADPEQYEDIKWSTPAWPWVDPLKDAQAALTSRRAGFTSRAIIVAEQGEDAAAIDAENTADSERAVELGLVYDSDPAQVLIGRETNPSIQEAEDTPEQEAGQKPIAPAKPAQPAGKPAAKPGSKAS